MIKLLGLICIVCAASGVGFGFARSVGNRQKQLRALISALSVMEGEIRYRMTPLGELFAQLSQTEGGAVGALFGRMADGLSDHRGASVFTLMKTALSARDLSLSDQTRQSLLSLASTMGRLDVDGQCRSILLANQQLSQELAALEQGGSTRAASYRTIGVCAGLAIAVILA